MKNVKKILVLFMLLLVLISFFNFKIYAAENDLQVDSPVALLMDSKTGKILYEKNIDKKMYPASLTKILTAIIVLEKCDLNETATVSYDAVMNISYGYLTANLQIGEELTVEQLLYVLMVGSSNDAAIVLAEHVSGSVEEFSKLMNEKAKELGCTSTNFVNPNGEHDKNHYTTARDLSIITRYAMQNETFRKIVSTTSYVLPKTNKYDKEDRLFTTTNSLLVFNSNDRDDNYYYKYAIGVKTGFTTPAQNCLIASANKGDLELLTVVLGAGETDDGLSARYKDTIKMFEYGYSNYTFREVIKAGGIVQTVVINNATRDTKKLDVAIANDVSVLIKMEDRDNALLPEVHLKEKLKAPIKAGDVIGTVTYNVEGIDYTEDLLASNDVKKSNLFLRILLIVVIIALVRMYLKSNNKKKRKNKLRRRINK